MRGSKATAPRRPERAEHQAVVTAVTDFWLEAAEAIETLRTTASRPVPCWPLAHASCSQATRRMGSRFGTAGCSGESEQSILTEQVAAVDVALAWDRHRVVPGPSVGRRRSAWAKCRNSRAT